MDWPLPPQTILGSPQHPWLSPPLLGREMPPALGPAVTLRRERQLRAGPAQQLPLLWATQQSWDLTKLGSSSLGMIFCRGLWGDGKGAHQQMWGSSPWTQQLGQLGCDFQLSGVAIPALVTGKGRNIGIHFGKQSRLSARSSHTHTANTAWALRDSQSAASQAQSPRSTHPTPAPCTL